MKPSLIVMVVISAVLASSGAGIVRAQSLFGAAPIDGIQCDSMEGSAEHIHAHLQLFDRGRPVEVPAGVGIPIGGNCLYWMHTHRADGIIHIESPHEQNFTLGQFFDIWGSNLSRTAAGPLHAARGKRLRISVDGRPWRGVDPRAIGIRNREEIVIQTGPPYGKPQAGKFP
ncbi:MAG TPA: hypothetical protein VIG51_10275 [Candidatus Baltobacteraceae bacterium]|jgi:hypothetical protein